MMNVAKNEFSAAQILAIPEHAPEKLFSGEPAKAQTEFRRLGRRWHPDCNPDPLASRVFQHLSRLYGNARELLASGRWRGPGELMLIRSGDLMRSVSFLRSEPFELGEVYIGQTTIVYAVKREFGDLFENARQQLAGFRFADPRMKREVARYLPGTPEYYATADRLILLLEKNADLVQLEDLRVFLGGEMDARHAAWIQSGLQNLACYFEYAGIVHNDIGPATYFVSPRNHTGCLLGGWWYAKVAGQRLTALPNRTLRLAPPDVIRRKQADPRVDLELVKATGRELLGDPQGARLRRNKKIPAAFANWVNGPTSGEAVTDYKLWNYALEMSFGKRRFVEMGINAADIYG
jgi:hypothetical protein